MSQRCSTSLTVLAKHLRLLVLTVSLITILSNGCTQAYAEQGLRQQCPLKEFKWVPLHLGVHHRMFSTMLNSASCPVWMTRHVMTKEPINTNLVLPKGVPFAFFCGLCHRQTKVITNITMMQTTLQRQQIAQVSLESSRGNYEHKVRSHECRVSYAVTAPLRDGGTLSCYAQYGKKNAMESATYTVKDAPIVKHEETVEVEGSTTILTCPRDDGPDTSENPLIHVWYYPHVPTATIVTPTTNPSATFQLTSEPLVVACATYRMYYVEKVTTIIFTVTKLSAYPLQGSNSGSSSNGKQNFPQMRPDGSAGPVWNGDHYEREEDESTGGSAKSSGLNISSIMLALVSAAGAVCLVLIIMFIMKCFGRRRSQQRQDNAAQGYGLNQEYNNTPQQSYTNP